MKEISVIGLDLAKTFFQVHGVNKQGEVVLRKKLHRKDMHKFFGNLKPCLIGIEACGGMHYWARELSRLGHTVKAIPTKFVKAFVKTNKNDANDAEAICEAVQRPNMRFAQIKTPEQQAILHLHHSRQLLVRQRVALGNHIRGLLSEFGIVLKLGAKVITKELPYILESAENGLLMITRNVLFQLLQQYHQLYEGIENIGKEIHKWHKSNEESQRLSTIPGIGILTATALSGQISESMNFKNGRQLSAYLGLVPAQASSGGKTKLLGISKRGDSYIRCLLIQGAKSVIISLKRQLKAGKQGINPWLESLLQKQYHINKIAVALANKMARIAWALFTKKEVYRSPTFVKV